MTNDAEIKKVEDKTEIDDNHSLEVEVLALEAVRDICENIAGRIDDKVKQKRKIVLASDGALLAAAGYRELIIHLDLLIDEGRKVLSTESTTSRAAAEPESLAATITGGLTSLVGILEFFRAETTIKDREITIDDSALIAALAGALIEKNFDVIRPERLPAIAGEGKHGLIQRLHELKTISADLKASQAGHPLAIRIDEHLQALEKKGDDQASPLSLAIGGAHIATLLDVEDGPLLLSSKIETAGGSYTIKKHLWNTLFFGNQLSYSAGAAISFSLIDGKSAQTVLSDLIYKLNGPGIFEGSWKWMNVSNLGSA